TLVERLDQIQFLEVWIGESPSSSLVGPDTMRKHLANCSFGVKLTNSDGFSIGHPFLTAVLIDREKAELLTDPDAEIFLSQAFRPCAPRCSEYSCAEERDKQKVIEVSGLKRGILAVVSKG